MKIRKMISALVVACMMVGTCTTAFAAENTSWKNYDYSKYSSNWSGSSVASDSTNGWSWGSGWTWGNGSGSGSGNNSSWSWGNGWNWDGGSNPGTGGDVIVEEDTSLAAPEIGECRYIHQTLNAPDCLVVNWSDVDGAVSYEMEMCYSDYTVIQTYTTEDSRYSISANRGDANVTGCCRGRKIRVRAIDSEGNPGKWSDYSTVGCNSIRG